MKPLQTIWVGVLFAGAAQAGSAGAPPAPHGAALIERFGVQAFVTGLLDDSAAPRWRAPAAVWNCTGPVDVLIDGRPLRAGAEAPARAFDIRWSMRGCKPFGRGGPQFDGSASGSVFYEESGMSLVMRVDGLRASHGGRTEVLAGVLWAPSAGPDD